MPYQSIKLLFVFVHLFYFINLGFAQNTSDSDLQATLDLSITYAEEGNDSTTIVIQQALDMASNPEEQIMAYTHINNYALSIEYMGRSAEAEEYLDLLIEFGEKVKNDSLAIIAISDKTQLYINSGRINEALEMALKAQQKYSNKTSPHLTVFLNLNLATIYSISGALDSASTYYFKVLRIAEAREFIEIESQALNGLINLAGIQGEYDKALDYADRALEIGKILQDTMSIASDHLAMAFIYNARSSTDIAQENDWINAQEYTEKALEYGLIAGNPAFIATCHLNLGIILLGQGHYTESHIHISEALHISSLIGDKYTETIASIQLSKIYNQITLTSTSFYVENAPDNIPQAAIDYAEHAYLLIDSFGINEVKVDVYDALCLAYANIGDSKKAYQIFQEYGAFNDSTAYAAQDEIIAETEAQFQNEKKQIEIDHLNQEKKRDARLLYTAVIGISVLLLLGVIILYFYRQKQRANKTLGEQNDLISDQKETLGKQNQEKELLLKEIHHRVKNNLQIVSSLLDLQRKKLDNSEGSAIFEEGKGRIRSMALIHQKLYQNENMVGINFKEYVQELSTEILASLTNNFPKIDININHAITFDIDTAIPLGLMLNELLTNACKYVYNHTPNGLLSIQLEQEDDNYILQIKDNGQGLPHDFNFQKTRSLGLRLVRRLSKQLLGKSVYSYDNGACFTITFKDTLARHQAA